ncbi:uncharacterized protein LOC119834926 [Zerene cesonia]|uniref:uncharacterized protein LOC119834926 n=1 Tax=Zerene cesonia TaxID=33412 RepID=UPI0018E53FB8|nr:uncharacterized protein LOC119834926 [Zerene cesonia]
MDEGKENINCYITELPDEIIAVILNYSSCNDIVSFGLTCKRFYNLTIHDQYLWKSKCIETLPPSIFKTVEKHSDGNWLNELKKYNKVNKDVISELMSMSSKFYWRMNQLSLEDVKEFFKIATNDQLSYFYTIHILQDVVQQGIKYLEQYVCERPYTLTDMHYAKGVLRFLFHTYLTIKWVKLQMAQELMPEVVLNFFVQWIDPANLYLDEIVNDALNDIVENVKDAIREARARKPPPPGWKKVTDKEVLTAMSQVLYGQRRIAITPAADLNTLNIVKVLKNKCGNAIVMAAIYQAVARKCGVKLELIAFPNHLFLEWLDDTDPHNVLLFTISLETGELQPKRRCPFSSSTQRSNYSYCPDSLLQYVYSSYLITMGAIRNWNTQNALHLLNFLGTSQNHQNPYKNFFAYLIEHQDLCATNTNLSIKYLDAVYRQIIIALSTLNKPVESANHNFVFKKHDNNVLYAVGMICYHKKYDYICIIRGWDLTGDHVHIPVDDLYFGRKQPFYRVTAADQSERYVAQENLIELTHPSRLYHLEDQISKEFSHFDGFAYVLNDEKKIEYPTEAPIIEMYRSRSLIKH